MLWTSFEMNTKIFDFPCYGNIGQDVVRFHPTQKPLELMGRAIKNSSKRGEIVLDLFGGSGSILISAEKEGRKAFLMELDNKYIQVIINRWEKLTNQKAHKVVAQ